MAKIRSVIELLASILQENNATDTRLKAETFRVAKFNGDEATPVLWRLLYDVVSYCKDVHLTIDHINQRDALTIEQLVGVVKKELHYLGYHSRELRHMPSNGSHGSRELLLALGWILLSENVIEKMMLKRSYSLFSGYDDTTFLHQQEDESAMKNNKQRINNSSSSATAAGLWKQLQQLLCYNNKLQMNLRNLYSANSECNILKHKIQESTTSNPGEQDQSKHRDRGGGREGDRAPLSMIEVFLLRHPQYLQQSLDLLEKDNERMHHLLLWWNSEEEVFWQWMESVLTASLSSGGESSITPPHSGSSEASCSDDNNERIEDVSTTAGIVGEQQQYDDNALRLTRREMDMSLSRLQDFIVKYETIVEHLEHIWSVKSSEVSHRELDQVLDSVNQELSAQRSYLIARRHLLGSSFRPASQQHDCASQRLGPASPLHDFTSRSHETTSRLHDHSSRFHDPTFKQCNSEFKKCNYYSSQFGFSSERSDSLSNLNNQASKFSTDHTYESLIQGNRQACSGSEACFDLGYDLQVSQVPPRFVLHDPGSSNQCQGQFSSKSQKKSNWFERAFLPLYSSLDSLLSGHAQPSGGHDVEVELQCMEAEAEMLERDLISQQEQLKVELESLIDKLKDSVCIPPLDVSHNV